MRNFFSEKSVAKEDLDISTWSPVYTGEMSEHEFQLFSKRKLAIDLFFTTNKPVSHIVKETGLSKTEFYRFANRCITYDNTSKIIGYRGLIPNFKVGNYSRKSFQNTNQETTNYSGSFQLLLQTYPDLKTFLLEEYFNLNMKKSSAREKKISIKNLHRKFIQECRKIGIKPNEYPFNTTSLAKKSVERFIKDISSQYIREVARNSGGQSTMLLNNTNNTISSNSTIIRPLERVQHS
jgi:putative transposase